MIKIAITGGIACGKSAVGEYLEKSGVVVCDADSLAHSVMTAGESVCERVLQEFGSGVADSDGGIDRVALGKIVFVDDAARRRLEAIVHPAVRAEWERWLAGQSATADIAAVQVPLLYEAGFGEGWDATVCVWASPAVQFERLMARNLTEDQARARVRAQWPLRQKVMMADYVLIGQGPRSVLQIQVTELVQRLMER